jgi:hypothetical protein
VGNKAAFAEIVREHQGMVFSIAYHFLHDRTIAEEVAQETFWQLHKHLDSRDEQRLHRLTHAGRKLAPKVCLEAVPEPSAYDVPGDPLLAREERFPVSLSIGDLHDPVGRLTPGRLWACNRPINSSGARLANNHPQPVRLQSPSRSVRQTKAFAPPFAPRFLHLSFRFAVFRISESRLDR